ncbi:MULTISPECIES: hypothetical protein [Bradyrhizobium]|uniref:Uncharacterized protein n=1 Tax=Bradyrhizobium frederickii TaxID=2560054 RepID=A0A4Y9NL15_9BRAD|nr:MULTISPECIES: hypothetical protein [Bradyrhizobium]TFV29544.1 hypothetical protein E4K66_37295 [Bradyrhizobium frederickii]TFV68072.1 hypothetical protein E4K64_37415 [Bradyrhizobium frederickii]
MSFSKPTFFGDPWLDDEGTNVVPFESPCNSIYLAVGDFGLAKIFDISRFVAALPRCAKTCPSEEFRLLLGGVGSR